MDRATKLILLVWACAALAFDVYLAARGARVLQPIALVVFVAAAALTAFSRKTIALVLVAAYLVPALLRTGELSAGILWMAALLGAIAPGSLRGSWRIPLRFRGPLICWALVVACGTVVAALRELDFNPGLLDWPAPVWSSIAGGPGPGDAASGILYAGLVPVLGILWFDWLLAGSGEDLRRWVTRPLLVSGGVMAAAVLFGALGGAATLWGGSPGRATSMAVIRAHRYFGVGVGSFQIIAPDLAAAPLSPDKAERAQNWYLHQFAELGAIGSLA